MIVLPSIKPKAIVKKKKWQRELRSEIIFQRISKEETVQCPV
jgi:hypothetical protein